MTPLSVLLIEDEPADSTLLKAVLSVELARGEVIIQTVRKLKVACAELQRMSFACALMDLGLPDGIGVEGITRLLEADPQVAVVVLTGLRDENAARRALELGAQDYLVKGEYDGFSLLDTIRRAVVRNQRLLELTRKNA